MNIVKNAAASTKKFVSDHKVAITVVATSACWIAMMRTTAKEHNDFLQKHGLYEEYYNQVD